MNRLRLGLEVPRRKQAAPTASLPSSLNFGCKSERGNGGARRRSQPLFNGRYFSILNPARVKYFDLVAIRTAINKCEYIRNLHSLQ